MISPKFTLPLLVLVSIVTLLFGLWPLDFFPENRVRWLAQQDGIQFYKQGLSTRRASGGVIHSHSPLDVRTGAHTFEPTTIEIYLESHGQRGAGLAHIVSFHDGYPRSPLVIGQWKSYLIVRSRDNQNDARDTYREIGLEHGLSTNEKKLITIASGPNQTEVYVSGELSRSYDKRSLIGVEHFSGYLNLGNSSIGHHAWVGNVYGLALYDTLLTSEQIQQHHMLWANDRVGLPTTLKPEPLILYTFTERTGAAVYNQVDNTNHLIIPSAFKALKRGILIRFWRDMAWDRGLVVDILVNVLGFIPFACCLLMFLTGNRHMSPNRATLLTVIASATLSLVIEIGQMGLPTRTPSSLDLLCNTLGAALGTMVFRIILGKRDASGPAEG